MNLRRYTEGSCQMKRSLIPVEVNGEGCEVYPSEQGRTGLGTDPDWLVARA